MNQEYYDDYQQNDYYHSQNEERYNNQNDRYYDQEESYYDQEDNGYYDHSDDRNYDHGNNEYYDQGFYTPPMDDFNWSPNLFAKLVDCINNSVSPDVIRMGIISDIKNSTASDEETPTNWDKVENMRRYVDSVNRGLGLPNDTNLLSLLQSAQWRGYGIYTMNFISEKNLDYKGICQDEQTNLSYASMIFLIALIKGMSMLNLRSPKQDDDHIYTFLIPSQFASFSFASFLNVANTRLANKEEITAEDIEGLTNLAFKNRYWKQGDSLKGADSELFVFILKSVITEILGITLDIDTNSFTEQAQKKEEQNAAEERLKKATQKSKEIADGKEKKLSMADAIEIVLAKFPVPQPKQVLIDEVILLRPETKEASLASIITMMHKQEIINFYEGGLIGIKGKRYGRGYKIVTRLQRRKKEDTQE